MKDIRILAKPLDSIRSAAPSPRSKTRQTNRKPTGLKPSRRTVDSALRLVSPIGFKMPTIDAPWRSFRRSALGRSSIFRRRPVDRDETRAPIGNGSHHFSWDTGSRRSLAPDVGTAPGVVTGLNPGHPFLDSSAAEVVLRKSQRTNCPKLATRSDSSTHRDAAQATSICCEDSLLPLRRPIGTAPPIESPLLRSST